MSGPRDYSFLDEPFREFLHEKAEVARAARLRTPFFMKAQFEQELEALVSRNVLTQEEVNTYILPVQNMTHDKAALIASLQTQISKYTNAPLHFSAEPVKETPEIRILDWTVWHLCQIGINSLKPLETYNKFWGYDALRSVRTQSREYMEPYQQCHWCGKRFSFDTPERKNKKYCHAPDCSDTSTSNPSEHSNCCSGEWGKLKRRYREKLRYYSSTTLSPEKKKALVTKSFKEFCNELYELNMDKEEDIVNRYMYGLVFLNHKFHKFAESREAKQFFHNLNNAINNFASKYGKLLETT